MTTTNSSLFLYNERATLVRMALERSPYLLISDVIKLIGKGVSVARQLVKEMEASGDLVIVARGWQRYYFREWPTADQIPPNVRKPRVVEEKPTLVVLRSPEERRGNTCCDECRRTNGPNLMFTGLIRARMKQLGQQAA